MCGGILETAVHATITVVVHGAIPHIVPVHHIDNCHNRAWIVGSIPVYLDIKDMAAPGQVVIRCFNLGFMAGAAFIIHGYVIGIRVIFPIRDSW